MFLLSLLRSGWESVTVLVLLVFLMISTRPVLVGTRRKEITSLF